VYRVLLVVFLVVSLVGVACGVSDESAEDQRLHVVTTVSPITSIADAIGGERIDLDGVVPEGVNSHTYEPAPSVALRLSTADLIIVNGLQLEAPLLQLAEVNKSDDAVILMLGDQTVTPEQWIFDFSFPVTEDKPNPHLWTDPILGLRYAELIEAELARLDPDNATFYATNLAAFRTRIEALDAAIIKAVTTVPEEQRKLVTYHDSWPYFSLRYGFEVLGAVQPSDFADPSPRELASLIDQVKAAGVPAVFGSEVFPSDVLETIAKETSATFVADLRDDKLPGEPGDPEHSYLGMMVANMELMIPALGGSAEAFVGLDLGPALGSGVR
jgi:ABC-type Zn uptake system ZnuABC Zn-binding protein ZnuA